jgi:hypothetical protein
MAAREDQQNATKGSSTNLPVPLRVAALAAELLGDACAPEAGDPLRLQVVRTLARDLAGELTILASVADSSDVVEGALRAADIANLAACTAPELRKACAMQAAAAAQLATGSARALCALARACIEDAPAGEYAQNALKDVRGALWRAQLAARQVDEFLGETV